MNYNELRRYSRNIILPEIGENGQKKLLDAKVLVIGAGGLGSPCALYLAASGIGTIGIVDDDEVEFSNLQRQILHETSDIGKNKAESAKYALLDLNPDIKVTEINKRLSEENAREIIDKYDIVADGSDNISTRFLVNDTCYFFKKTLVSAAVVGFQGQISTFKAYMGEEYPCYRCLYPVPPPQDTMPSCSHNGIFAPIAGILGAMQAGEVMKEILNIGESLSGYLLRFNIKDNVISKTKLNKDKECPLCGGG